MASPSDRCRRLESDDKTEHMGSSRPNRGTSKNSTSATASTPCNLSCSESDSLQAESSSSSSPAAQIPRAESEAGQLPLQIVSSDQAGQINSLAGSKLMGKKTRGKTIGKVLNRLGNRKFKIEFDGQGRVIGHYRSLFSTQIGLIVRNASVTPLKVKDFSEIDKNARDNMLNSLKERVEWDGDRDDLMYRIMKDRFRGYRSRLKKNFYDCYLTDEERLQHPPPDVPDDAWRYLIKLFSSPEFQAMSTTNKQNRSNLRLPHCTGRRGFAQVEAAEVQKTGQPCSDIRMFELTHQRSDGTWVNGSSKDVMLRMTELTNQRDMGACTLSDEDIVARILGTKRHGRIRTMDKVSTPSSCTISHSQVESNWMQQQREINEAKKAASEATQKVQELEAKLEAVLEEVRELRSQRQVLPSLPSQHATFNNRTSRHPKKRRRA